MVGIDGCGKSSVIAHLRRLAAEARGSLRSITCPSFHDTPDAPLHELSRRIKAFSDATDEVSSPEAKGVSLYLQMTLYGPIERFFLDTFAPSVLVCERHPIVETLVYGPFYIHLAQAGWDGTDVEPKLRAVLDRDEPGRFDSVLAWHRAEAVRLGLDIDVWGWLPDVAQVAQRDLPSLVAELEQRYRTTVPDRVIWLDLPPEQAAARCVARSGGGALEMHETVEFLGLLRDGYTRMKDQLAESFPHVGFHVVDTSDSVDLGDSVRACIEQAELFA
jgi:thymidylate kinase